MLLGRLAISCGSRPRVIGLASTPPICWSPTGSAPRPPFARVLMQFVCCISVAILVVPLLRYIKISRDGLVVYARTVVCVETRVVQQSYTRDDFVWIYVCINRCLWLMNYYLCLFVLRTSNSMVGKGSFVRICQIEITLTVR